MNFADIKRVDVANGLGVRVSLFVSGCTHRCPRLLQPGDLGFHLRHPLRGGAAPGAPWPCWTRATSEGLSLLGGEPFEPENQGAVLELVRRVRRELPQKDIWCYTGYLYEELAAGKVGAHGRELLEELDVLVDGPFVEAQKDLKLRFRGSANQASWTCRPAWRRGTPACGGETE